MTVTIEKLENNEVKLNIEVEAAVSSFEYDKACRKLARKVNVPGFRQGKAPKNILEKYVGISALQKEVLDSILPAIFDDAIAENNFDLITSPNIESFEFADDKSIKITAKFELRPEVNLKEYKGIEVNIDEFKHPDNALETELNRLADRYAVLNDIKDRKSVNTDLVNIDFAGYSGGEEIKAARRKIMFWIWLIQIL